MAEIALLFVCHWSWRRILEMQHRQPTKRCMQVARSMWRMLERHVSTCACCGLFGCWSRCQRCKTTFYCSVRCQR